MIVIDDFLDSYSELKELSLTCSFDDKTNSVDGVTYPHIFEGIPDNIREEIIVKIGSSREFMFMRMSPKGVSVPHIAHTDNSMGDYSLMLYLNSGPGGTSFLRHKQTGICYAPEDEVFVGLVSQDINSIDAWAITESVPMKENRALIFNSHFFHRAEPIGGFGDTQLNSRIVLTCFYDKTGN